jgi:hypothetical protein
MEAHADPDSHVSTKDVDRVERGIKKGDARADVFPKLDDLTTTVSGVGATGTVHVTKKQGAPVRYVADDSTPAAAIREVDLDRKFYLSATELADRVGLTGPKATALRRHLGVDDDPRARYTFVMGSQRHPRYSDAAVKKMSDALEEVDMDEVWEGHKPAGRSKKKRTCTVPGCEA